MVRQSNLIDRKNLGRWEQVDLNDSILLMYVLSWGKGQYDWLPIYRSTPKLIMFKMAHKAFGVSPTVAPGRYAYSSFAYVSNLDSMGCTI